MPITMEKIRKFSGIVAKRSDIKLGTELKKLSKKTDKGSPEDVIREFRHGEDDL